MKFGSYPTPSGEFPARPISSKPQDSPLYWHNNEWLRQNGLRHRICGFSFAMWSIITIFRQPSSSLQLHPMWAVQPWPKEIFLVLDSCLHSDFWSFSRGWYNFGCCHHINHSLSGLQRHGWAEREREAAASLRYSLVIVTSVPCPKARGKRFVMFALSLIFMCSRAKSLNSFSALISWPLSTSLQSALYLSNISQCSIIEDVTRIVPVRLGAV